MLPLDFFNKYASDAKEALSKTGILASVTLAQAALESGWGQFAFGNNFFGIKAGENWTGNKQLLRTTEILPTNDAAKLKAMGCNFPEVIDCVPYEPKAGYYVWHIRDYFRAYDTPADGFIDHANFFKQNSRYAQAIIDEANPDKFCEDIALAHYSTTPNYAQVLLELIKEHNLTQHDETN